MLKIPGYQESWSTCRLWMKTLIARNPSWWWSGSWLTVNVKTEVNTHLSTRQDNGVWLTDGVGHSSQRDMRDCLWVRCWICPWEQRYTTMEAIGCAKGKQRACITIRNGGAPTLTSFSRFQASIHIDNLINVMQAKQLRKKRAVTIWGSCWRWAL